MTPTYSNKITAAVIAGILALIGVIFAAILQYESKYIPIHATQTAEAKITSISIISGISTKQIQPETTILPTATINLIPISTPTQIEVSQAETPLVKVTPFKTPKIIFSDNFLDNHNGWLIEHTKGGEGEVSISTDILDGKYIHKLSCPAIYTAPFCGEYFRVPKVSIKDFILTFDATIENVSDGTDVIIGIQVRRQQSDNYLFSFYETGNYTVVINRNTEVGTLNDGSMGKAFSQEIGKTNHISISALGPNYDISVNDQHISHIEDGNIADPGSIIMVWSVEKGGIGTIDFDNLIISENP